MSYILSIETSCDETAAAVYDTETKRMLSSELYSQIELHKKYGGTVPEIASRSHLEKIDIIVRQALEKSKIDLKSIDIVAVTSTPGLVGSLLIGICFAKGIAWAGDKKLVAVNHLEGHIYSAFLCDDMAVDFNALSFPYICLSVSGGHTSFYLVESFSSYREIGGTIDDAAGEAFDKTSRALGLGYPGGSVIEKLAREVEFEDFFKYPRGKRIKKDLNFSFSGLKTAILYDLVRRGAFDLNKGIIEEKMTDELKKQVSSSLLVCMADIFEYKLGLALSMYPKVKGFAFVGGVACNKYLTERLKAFCEKNNVVFKGSPRRFSTDNAAMIALVGANKAERGEFADFYMDVFK